MIKLYSKATENITTVSNSRILSGALFLVFNDNVSGTGLSTDRACLRLFMKEALHGP